MHIANFKFIRRMVFFYRNQPFLLFSLLVLLASFSLSAQTSPTVTLTDTDTDNLLSASDTVTITATFSEAMVATPTISIASTSTTVLTDFLTYNPEFILTNTGTTTDTTSGNGSDFGYGVSLSDDGKYMLVGYYSEDDFFSDGTSVFSGRKPGAAYLYENINGSWTFSQKFNFNTGRTGSNKAPSNILDWQGEEYYRQYAYRSLLSGDGNTVLITSKGDRDSEDNFIDVYKKINGSWELTNCQGYNNACNIFSRFGSNTSGGAYGTSMAVSNDGSIIAIGSTSEFKYNNSFNENNGQLMGDVRVYQYNPSATNSYTLIGYFAGNDRNGDAL